MRKWFSACSSMFASPTELLATLQRPSQQYTVNCIVVCVFQRNALGLWCASDMLCPEASVQADPRPWLQSAHSFMSRSEYAALHLSPHLFSLPTWQLRAPPAENLGSEGTLHERKPAALTVWCFRASVGGGECAVAGRQWKHFWHCHGGWEAPYQPQVIIRISYNPTSTCEGGVSSSDKFLFTFRSNNFRWPRHHDTHSLPVLYTPLGSCFCDVTHLQTSTKLNTSNLETLLLGNIHISHIQKQRRVHTHTHKHKLKIKTPSVWQQQTNTQLVKSIMYTQQDAEGPTIFNVQHCPTHRRIWRWGQLLASASKI